MDAGIIAIAVNLQINKLLKMEIEKHTQQDCGCSSSGDCCTPKKSKLWMKIVFIVIVVAAMAIVTVKLVNSNNCKSDAKGVTVATEKSGCGDSTKSIKCVKICDPEKNPSCCPKAKK